MPVRPQDALMTLPIWIDCGTIADVELPQELGMMATPGNHVVLRFRAIAPDEMAPLIGRLSAALPDHSVFTSGEAQVTIKPVVPRSRILERRSRVVDAIKAYKEACMDLSRRYENENLPSDWSSQEHGEHRRFKNSRTGQVVEVPIPGLSDPDHIDPYFFSEFVKTTVGLESVAELIGDSFHDGARLLDVVEGGA
jgi:hypothetical protein